jgi:alkylation response protein AidB-like acyl-CoA dehydrogenase
VTAGFAEVHDDLRAVARDILSGTTPAAAGGASPVLIPTRRLADTGWLGLEVPEALGGAGATLAEAAIILQEMGRAVSVSTYLGSAVLGVGALNLVEPGPGRDNLLRNVATGTVGLAVVMPASDDALDAPEAMTLERSAEVWRLHGAVDLVPDAGEADHLLIVARAPEGGSVLVDLTPSQPDIEVEPRPVVDASRRLAAVTAGGVAVRDTSVLRFAGEADAGARRVVERGALAVACDSLGLAEAMLDATVSYVRGRHQFGRPVGSFQAVKHACADMLVHISVARRLVGSAVDAVAAGDPDAWVAVSRAKSYTCEAAVEIAGKAMQLHGGIGYTWDSGIHVYLKRAVLNRSLFGSPGAHRKRLGARFG